MTSYSRVVKDFVAESRLNYSAQQSEATPHALPFDTHNQPRDLFYDGAYPTRLDQSPQQSLVEQPSGCCRDPSHSRPVYVAQYLQPFQRYRHRSEPIAHPEDLDSNEIAALSKSPPSMAVGQYGSFRPQNTLENLPNTHKFSHGNTTSRMSNSIRPVARRSSSGYPPQVTIQDGPEDGERGRKRIKMRSYGEAASIPDSDSDGVTVTGHLPRSKSSLRRESTRLFSSRNEYKIVEKLMKSETSLTTSLSRGRTSPARSERATQGLERSHYFKTSEDTGDDRSTDGSKSKGKEKIVDMRMRKADADHKRRKTTHSPTNLKPSKALDAMLHEAGDSLPKNVLSTSRHPKGSRLLPDENIRHKFVRVVDEGDEDELQMSSAPHNQALNQMPKRSTKLQDPRSRSTTQTINEIPGNAKRKNESSADIKPTVFLSSKAQTPPKSTPKADENNVDYDLVSYHNGTIFRNGDKQLKLVIDRRSNRWMVQSERSTLNVDQTDVATAYIGDCNAKRAQFCGNARQHHITAWHHFIFKDALSLRNFQRDELGALPLGVRISYKDEEYLKRLLHETQKKGVDKLESRSKREPLTSTSTTSGSKDAKIEVKKSRQPLSVARSNPHQNLVSSMRSEPGQISSQILNRNQRTCGMEGIMYEDAETGVPPSRRQTRQSTHDNSFQVDLSGQTNCEPGAQSRKALVRKYSEGPGLGLPWSTSLVFPRKGVHKATVEFDDLIRLDEGEFLNDNLVAFCLKYAQHLSPHNASRVHVFNSFFYEKLTSKVPKGKKINYDAVKRWTMRAKIFEGGCDHIIVPINEDFHWYVAIICNVSNIKTESGVSVIENTDESPKDGPAKDGPAKKPAAGSKITRTSQIGSGKLFVEESELAQNTSQMSLDDQFPTTDAHDRQLLHEESRGDAPIHSVVVGAVDVDASEAKKRKSTGGKRRREPEDPVILVLDSLPGSHPPLSRCLKDYLTAEANHKISQGIEEPPASFERSVPGQDNFSDCGLYLVGYVSRFLEDPNAFIKKAACSELADDPAWRGLRPDRMRHNIRNIIMHEYVEQLKEQPDNRDKKKKELEQAGQFPPRPKGSSAYLQFTASSSTAEVVETAQQQAAQISKVKEIGAQLGHNSDDVSQHYGFHDGAEGHKLKIVLEASPKAARQNCTLLDRETNKIREPNQRCLDAEPFSHPISHESSIVTTPSKRKRQSEEVESKPKNDVEPERMQAESNEFSEQWYQELTQFAQDSQQKEVSQRLLHSEASTAQEAPINKEKVVDGEQDEFNGFSEADEVKLAKDARVHSQVSVEEVVPESDGEI